MSRYIMISMVFLLIGGTHLYFLFRKKLIKEAVVSAVLYMVSLVYALGEVRFWDLPSPSGFIVIAFQPLAEIIFGVTLK